MKRILLLVTIFFCLCGCGNKLTCTYEEKYEDVKIKNKITFNFKGNTYKQIDKMIFEDEEEAKDYFKDVEEYIEEYNLKLDGKTIISEINDEIKLKAGKKEIKEQYESYDYKCK